MSTPAEYAAPPQSRRASLAIRAMPGVFVFLWSTGFIGAKYGLPYVEPLTFLTVRFAIVTALLVPIAVLARAAWPRRPAQIAHVAVVGLLVHATYLGGVFSAIDRGLPAGVAALIVALQPAVTAVVVGPLLGDRVTRLQGLGFVLGFAGVATVLLSQTAGATGELLAFDGFGLGAVGLAVAALIGITAGTIYQKRFCTDLDLWSSAVIQYVAAGVATGLGALATETMRIQWTGEFLFALGWLTLVLSIGAISLLMLLIRRGAASRVASLFYLVPPSTALIAYLIFGETLGVAGAAGVVITAAGVALVFKAAPTQAAGRG
jgi:drug/metabolite transporter (DMT)-like permease